MKEVKALQYGSLETYTEDADLFCPSCGHKGIWIDNSDDYYHGCGHWCVACGYIFHLTCDRHAEDDHDTKNLEALKKAISH